MPGSVGGGDPLVNKIDKNACPHGAYVLEGESGRHVSKYSVGLPWWLSGKESACQAGDSGSIPGLGRFPEEGNGNLLQYACLGNPIDRGAWWATVHGVAKESDPTWQLNNIYQFILNYQIKFWVLKQ